ncbi:MAG: hypothetical protein CMN02_01025 [Roseibacillus sp.]|nr:hypothetical protein [Roseibacillus sp.]|tara:strand:+ start:1284 stop:3083 length:1800 start_codon:yes stop_codon:yes gene_type:complete
MKYFPALLLLLTFAPLSCLLGAELSVAHFFGDHMVIQRDKPIRIWGTSQPGENVRVRFSIRDLTVKADTQGNWRMELEALPVSSQGKAMVIQSGDTTITYDNILVGDVWVCGGQSNMEDEISYVYHGDMEVSSANHPMIRLMTVPQQASPVAFTDMARINEFNSWTRRHEKKGSWSQCSPKAVERFSAIGYIFGKRIHLVSGVPIGLIDNSWGGTTIEAWTSRDTLEKIPAARGLLEEWDTKIAAYDAAASLQARIQRWEKDSERRKARGEKPNPKPTEPDQDPASDRNNPGASFNGMLASFSEANIKGVIFNQGYNNALGNARPRLYASVIQTMIENWREMFRDNAMPFGIIGLTPGGQPQTRDNYEIRMVDAAPFIREGQFKAAKALNHVCFMPAYDQQVPFYHPHKKVLHGERMARWALATQYGQTQLKWNPTTLEHTEISGDHVILSFNGMVRVHDGRPFEGFAVAGKDRHFVPARAEFVVKGKDDRGREQKDESKLKVWSPLVPEPVAVRYAWARNPLGNAVNSGHHERIIPIPSFRTDNWDWPEAPFESDREETRNAHREAIGMMRRKAREWSESRPEQEARILLGLKQEEAE